MADANPLGHNHPAERADNQHPSQFGQTPWQTVGPFFHYSLPWKGGADLVGASTLGARPELFPSSHDLLHQAPAKAHVQGERIELRGHVLDAAGAPVPDAMLEIWQANAAGRYAALSADGFIGFGRTATSEAGGYRFLTIRPGRVPGPGNTLQAPHVAIGVFGRGLLKRLVTRLYFADDPANDEDPILQMVSAARRPTLLAQRRDGVWQFDIHLQGARETVFFDV
jgi:protocatechuate 3,4-dioxygenase alpha subunit